MVEPTAELAAQRFTSSGAIPLVDSVAVEEPLVITVNGHPYVTTMRTPGDDCNLAKGLLYTDGIIQDSKQITNIHVTENHVEV
ncbi:MAG: formate dehydrogenase accessory sulfurtransferase FdhD, partial [Candidatus Thalassarchaeaceae archaeon]|nr:formate dehydrogenase accessory sulfurtransferase FdhD [Candidatus Thalassarchaeaceae archaeon]